MEASDIIPKRIDCGAHSRRGLDPDNRDRFVVGHLGSALLVAQSNTVFENETRAFGRSHAHLLLVANGFGPASGASAAESVACTLVQEMLGNALYGFRREVALSERVKAAMAHAVEASHLAIEERGRGDAASDNTGSTLTAAFILWPHLFLAHLGNGRGYLVRDSGSRRLTTDHVRPACPTADGGPKPVLTSAVGAGLPRPTVQFVSEELETGDRVLLCTPGLAEFVDDDRLPKVMKDTRSASATAAELVDAAVVPGSSSDATAVVARFVNRERSEPS